MAGNNEDLAGNNEGLPGYHGGIDLKNNSINYKNIATYVSFCNMAGCFEGFDRKISLSTGSRTASTEKKRHQPEVGRLRPKKS